MATKNFTLRDESYTSGSLAIILTAKTTMILGW